MKDEVRAGMTSVQMYLNSNDVAAQLKCLAQAEEHFEAALSTAQARKRRSMQPSATQGGATPTREALSDTEVGKSLRTVRRQMEVTKLFQETQTKIGTPLQFSLFGPTNKQVSKIINRIQNIMITTSYI